MRLERKVQPGRASCATLRGDGSRDSVKAVN